MSNNYFYILKIDSCANAKQDDVNNNISPETALFVTKSALSFEEKESKGTFITFESEKQIIEHALEKGYCPKKTKETKEDFESFMLYTAIGNKNNWKIIKNFHQKVKEIPGFKQEYYDQAVTAKPKISNEKYYISPSDFKQNVVPDNKNIKYVLLDKNFNKLENYAWENTFLSLEEACSSVAKHNRVIFTIKDDNFIPNKVNIITLSIQEFLQMMPEKLIKQNFEKMFKQKQTQTQTQIDDYENLEI